jgi:hypothetical protein
MYAITDSDPAGRLPRRRRGRVVNRATRRAAVRRERRRMWAIARANGCTCRPELMVSPVSGAPRWARRPEGGQVYIVRHAEWCPLQAEVNLDEWVIVDEPKVCER